MSYLSLFEAQFLSLRRPLDIENIVYMMDIYIIGDECNINSSSRITIVL